MSQARGWRSRPEAGQPGPSSSDDGWRSRPEAGQPGPSRPLVVILCGGRGTRLQEHTQAIPKPLVEIGGMPIVWHVIQLYAAQGFRRFLLATGYRGELIEAFVAAHAWPEGVSVNASTPACRHQTGGRVKLLERRLAARSASA